mgnify:CR=1 FL=1|tara:strand:- start:1877 stop:2089 length:213 start_codon:yes stop_codon:yes gene_type:complete
MKKYIGITLLLGLTVSVFVVDNSEENKSQDLTIESDYLFLDRDITSTENLLDFNKKEEKKEKEDLIWLRP